MKRHYLTAIITTSMALLIPLQSCDDDGDDTSISSLCENFCDQIMECYGQIAFDDSFSSMVDCKDECADDLEEAVEDLEGNCEKLYREYLACVYGLSCQDLSDEYHSAGDECDHEWDVLVDECDAEDGGDPNNQCTEGDVNACYDAYEACIEPLEPESDTYLEDMQVCLDDYCDCLTAAGCDMSGYDCGSGS